jgi:uncharacterized membrane protein YdjX (TVP38/TMEM64 family)
MDPRMRPWAIAGGIVMLAFVVWLFSSMAGTEESNQVLLILTVCALIIGVALMIGLRLGRRDDTEDREGT